MTQDYYQMKPAVIEALRRLTILFNDYGISQAVITMLQDKLSGIQQDIFHLVVLGQYKRGKSTFLNAILGAELLPTAIIPLTSIVTFLQYGENIRIKVVFLDGKECEITLEQLPLYVMETENSNNVKNVERVEINYPSPYLKEGVILIDTPGIGSVFQHNTDMTYDFLAKVDAAIFILSADPPISREECRFLQDVTQYVRKIFFVQNKIDLVEQQDWEQSLVFSKSVIEHETDLRDVLIHPLSAKQAVAGIITGEEALISQSRMQEFIMHMEAFINNERKVALLTNIVFLAQKLVADVLLKLDLECSSLNLPIEQLKEKLARLQECIESVNQDKNDVAYLLKGELQQFNASLEQDLRAFREGAFREISQEMVDFCERHMALSTAILRKELDSFLAEAITGVFEKLRLKMEQAANDWLEQIVRRFEGKNHKLIETVQQLAANLFNMKIQPDANTITLYHKSRLYFLTELPKPMFSYSEGFIVSLLPQAWSRRLLIKSRKEQIFELVDMNSGRIRYDVYSRVAKSVEDFRHEFETSLNTTINDLVGTIETAVKQKDQGEQIACQRRLQLEQIRAGILEVRSTLRQFQI